MEIFYKAFLIKKKTTKNKKIEIHYEKKKQTGKHFFANDDDRGNGDNDWR